MSVFARYTASIANRDALNTALAEVERARVALSAVLADCQIKLQQAKEGRSQATARLHAGQENQKKLRELEALHRQAFDLDQAISVDLLALGKAEG